MTYSIGCKGVRWLMDLVAGWRLQEYEDNPRGWGGVVKQLVRLSWISLHSKTEKHDNSPICCWIATVPKTQSLLRCIRGRWNAWGGWWHHHRRRAAVGSVGDWRCNFFRCCRCRRIGEAAVDGSTKAARLLMMLHLGRRLLEFEDVWWTADISLQ